MWGLGLEIMHLETLSSGSLRTIQTADHRCQYARIQDTFWLSKISVPSEASKETDVIGGLNVQWSESLVCSGRSILE